MGQILACGSAAMAVTAVGIPLGRNASVAHQAEGIRQVGQAILVYAADHDEVLPLATTTDDSGATRMMVWISVPEGWKPGPHSEHPRKTQDAAFWANATRPYYQDLDALSIADAPVHTIGSIDYDRALKPFANVGWTYNGMLHAWSKNEVASPSTLPLLWEGFGRMSIKGHSISQPLLLCQSQGPCRFNPGGLPQKSDHVGPWAYVWTGLADPPPDAYLGGGYYLSVDQTLTQKPLAEGAGVGHDEPFSGPGYMAECSTIDVYEALYPCYFRPDAEPGKAWKFKSMPPDP